MNFGIYILSRLTAVNQKLSSGLRQIISNIGWLFVERALSMVLSLSVGIYVVRYLEPENFGRLSYGTSFVGLFGVIAKLGLDSIVVRNIVRDENSTEEILGTAFVLKFIGSLVTVALIVSATWAINDDLQVRRITLIVAFGLVFQSFEVIDFWFQSKVLSGALVVVRSAALILSSVTKLSFIALKLPLVAFAWLMLVDVLLSSFGMIWVYCKHNQSFLVWKVSWSKARELLKDSCPLILSAVMITIYVKIDQVMLGNMASNEAVGNYAAAVRFSEIWYFVPIAICSSVFPAIIRTKQRSEQEYYSRLQQLYDLMAGVSLMVAIPMTFVSGSLITSLLGEEYASAGTILALHIWSGPFVFLGVARSQWLMTENLTRFSFLTTSLGAITNVVLNLILIPKYQGNGAALATVISYAVVSHVACLLYPPMFDTGLMLAKALFIPFRVRQNLVYLSKVRIFFGKFL